MWKVKNFQPNEVVTTGTAVVTADGQGRLKTVKFNNILNQMETTVYYEDDPPIPDALNYKTPLDAEAGDWIKSDDNAYAQVLRTVQYKKRTHRMVTTAFGVNSTGASNGFLFLVDRVNFFRFPATGRPRSYGLTHIQRSWLAAYVMLDCNPYKAYTFVTGKELTSHTKYSIIYRFNKILNTPDGKAYLMNEIEKVLTQRGITVRDWITKIVDSTEGNIKTSVQLQMWLTIGKFLPGVKEALDGEVLPEKSFGTASEATYTDVCAICSDTGRYITQAPDGQNMEVVCPLCSKKLSNGSNGKVQSLPETASGLRV